MQTTSFQKGFLNIIGGAVLLSSGTIWAQDEPRHPRDRMEAHHSAPQTEKHREQRNERRDEKHHHKHRDEHHEKRAFHNGKPHHPAPEHFHAHHDRGYASFHPVYVTEYVEYAAPKHRRPHWENQLLFMVQSLTLSSRQEMELRLIFKERHAERKALRHKHIERIHSLLTPQQRHHWHELREERKAHNL